eukprot:1346903-Rhodomonas_salina.1
MSGTEVGHSATSLNLPTLVFMAREDTSVAHLPSYAYPARICSVLIAVCGMVRPVEDSAQENDGEIQCDQLRSPYKEY